MQTDLKDEQNCREALCEIGRRLWQRGLVAANDGNLSVRLSTDRILCTPSGVSKGFLRPDDLVLTDEFGVSVSQGKASSELKMHIEIYRQRQDVNAVVHAHPPHATAFALSTVSLPRYVMPEMEVLLGPIAVLPYKTPGTAAFAEAFLPALGSSDVFMLSNHGATCVGKTLEDAWHRMESLDQCCRTLLLAGQLGTIKEIVVEDRECLDQQWSSYRNTH